MLGLYLEILENKNWWREDKYCQREDKIEKDEIKKFQSLTPGVMYNVYLVFKTSDNPAYKVPLLFNNLHYNR